MFRPGRLPSSRSSSFSTRWIRFGLGLSLALGSVACSGEGTEDAPKKFVPKPERVASAQAERAVPLQKAPTSAPDPLADQVCDVATRPDPKRWANEVRKYQEQDNAHFPDAGRVVFVGSSSIRLWGTLERDMAPVLTLRRGLGGAFIADTTHYAETLIAPYEPSAIVLYAGDNDIAKGLPAACIAKDAQAFVAKVRELGVEAPVYLVSIKPSPGRLEFWPRMQEANRLLQLIAKEDPEVHYIDVSEAMLADDGQLKPELFQKDKLHLSNEGYRTWTERLRPALLRQS